MRCKEKLNSVVFFKRYFVSAVLHYEATSSAGHRAPSCKRQVDKFILAITKAKNSHVNTGQTATVRLIINDNLTITCLE